MIAMIVAAKTRRIVIGRATRISSITGFEVRVNPKSGLPIKTPKTPRNHRK